MIFIPITYYGSSVSPHIDKTPEGYLICRDVPINRTGTQTYLAHELGLDGDPDRPVTVYRLEEDVFDPAALASFEGKDVTRGHPPEMLTAENHASYSMGHLENVRRVGDNTVADLIIKDSTLASDVENRTLREVSCGYNCNFEPYQDGYKQTRIRGNHLAVVPRGRAGGSVSIHDATPEVEKGRNKPMSKFSHAILTAFGMAAKDASPEELDGLVSTADAALEAEPAAPEKDAAPEAAPAEDEMIEKAPKGDDIGSKLDRILEMLEAKSRGGRGEHPLHDESDLDEMIEKLGGKKDPEASVTVEAEEMEDAGMCTANKDAAMELLKRVRPAVAAISDPGTKARVTDALLSAVRGNGMEKVVKATTDAARAPKRQSYDAMCAESEANYAAMNPHKKKEA